MFMQSNLKLRSSVSWCKQ